MGADWIADAVLYEIYPQSFADANGDGIGDLRGVIERLDHIASLGVDTIWFNPCFASPFVDAGYDVSDYLTIAPRYGTNDDMVELVTVAKERGIRILLDLVAGHTSIEHPWFQKELHADGPDPAGDRYVWCEQLPPRVWPHDVPGRPAWVPSPGPREGWYLKNFYDEQPALNFGWTRSQADEPWRDAVDAPGPRRNRQALQDVIAFWLDRGIAGFRVDMALSLIKTDPDEAGGPEATVGLWRDIRAWLDVTYPDAVIVPEGTEPRTGLPPAFHADFFLVIRKEHASLFDNHARRGAAMAPAVRPLLRRRGPGSTRPFLDGWHAARQADPARPVILSSADHDFDRLRCGPRTPQQLGAALTFLFTWGSVPCLYYGDEIGMRYLPGMPDVEGAVCNPGYNRAGCRTPMQWDRGPNAGFSAVDPARLYLPVDPDPARPTVAAQEHDPDSTLNLVRRLIALRRATSALGGRATTRVLHEGYPFVYLRGESHLVVVNPRREQATVSASEVSDAAPLLVDGVSVVEGTVTASGFGYGIFTLTRAAGAARSPA